MTSTPADYSKPLDDDEHNRLGAILDRFPGDQAMNLEEAEGFFAALHCAPDMSPPSLFLEDLWGGGDLPDNEFLPDDKAVNEFIKLALRFWNEVGRKLQNDEVFLPLLYENAEGKAQGNDWALGFMRGMHLHHDDWLELLDDKERGGCLVPILVLAHEHDPDPALRPYNEPVSDERRELLLATLAGGVTVAYRYFVPRRRMAASGMFNLPEPYRRKKTKVGRNAACPCGSGRKYKKCCGTDMRD